MLDKRSLARGVAILLAALLAACATAAPAQTPRREAMAAAANPHAVAAAIEILREGGGAIDAAIAAEAVLGLVEPQSSGIGGGGFLLHYDGRSQRIVAYDGRERAPASATPEMFLTPEGTPMPFFEAQMSGLSIGAPSLVAMLELAHQDHGRLPWARLFEPAIRLADEGFAVSPRLARFLELYRERGALRHDPAAGPYFYDAAGAARPVGYLLRNPDYARSLRAIAADGADALRRGPIADAIVAAAQRAPRAGGLAHGDLEAVRARRLAPVCGRFRNYRACTMPPPSSAVTVVEILGLYERARPAPEGAQSIDDWAAFLWASRLAYADRDHYLADDRFAPVPTRALVSPSYLRTRARLIALERAPPEHVAPGAPAGRGLLERWGRIDAEGAGTTHVSIVDAWGNAVALTASVESGFGAQRMAGGFLLNNQLTDFAFQPTLNGRPVANAAAPGKAPRSSMAPLIVTDGDGDLELVIGSPGGSTIIAYVARATIGILDWDLPVQEALNMGNAMARGTPVVAETAALPAGVEAGLQDRGWSFAQPGATEVSGLHAIRVTAHGLEGGADPRREGAVGRLPPPPP